MKLLAKTIVKCSNNCILSLYIFNRLSFEMQIPAQSLVFCRLPLRVEYTCCGMIRRPKEM